MWIKISSHISFSTIGMQWGDCFHNISYNSCYWSPLLPDLYPVTWWKFQTGKETTELTESLYSLWHKTGYIKPMHILFFLQQEQEIDTCCIIMTLVFWIKLLKLLFKIPVRPWCHLYFTNVKNSNFGHS